MMRNTATIEEVAWLDVKDSVAMVNPELADIIECLHPDKSKKLTLFRARYPFGAKITDHGLLHLPNEYGNIVPINDTTIPEKTQEKLSYNPVPLALVTKNNAEVFTISEHRFVPFKLFSPGEFFGTWELLDPTAFKQQAYSWNFSAGARSIFMLPKISEAYSYSKLRSKYSVTPSTPKYLADHHEIFTTIANHPDFPNAWHNEIIFFPKEWLKQISCLTNNAWAAFYFFILKVAWMQSLNWRNQLNTELIWQSLADEMSNRNMHPRHYLINTVKHLITIGMGTAPAFVPATNSCSAPIAGLQNVYEHDYGLKYTPTIMIPNHLETTSKKLPVYYSLQTPTLLTYTPNTSHIRSTMKDIQDIKYLMDALLYKLKKDNKPPYQLVKNIVFDYFHTELDKHSSVRLTENIPKEDDRFIKTAKPFSVSASFLRGCVRISRIEED